MGRFPVQQRESQLVRWLQSWASEFGETTRQASLPLSGARRSAGNQEDLTGARDAAVLRAVFSPERRLRFPGHGSASCLFGFPRRPVSRAPANPMGFGGFDNTSRENRMYGEIQRALLRSGKQTRNRYMPARSIVEKGFLQSPPKVSWGIRPKFSWLSLPLLRSMEVFLGKGSYLLRSPSFMQNPSVPKEFPKTRPFPKNIDVLLQLSHEGHFPPRQIGTSSSLLIKKFRDTLKKIVTNWEKVPPHIRFGELP